MSTPNDCTNSDLEAEILVDHAITVDDLTAYTEVCEDRLVHSGALEKAIENAWRREVARTGRKDSSQLVGLRAWRRTDDRVHLLVGPTTYREFVGTRERRMLTNPGIQSLANPIGVCCVITTADDRVLIERRPNNDYYGGALHVVGGMVDWRDDRRGDQIDFAGAIVRECEEEVGFKPDRSSVKCVGIAYDANRPHAELCFSTRCQLTWEEVRERASRTPEFQNMVEVEAHAEALKLLLGDAGKAIVPTGRAALLLHAATRFPGDPWFRQEVARRRATRLRADLPSGTG